jgi:hypothetical protein
MGGNYWFCVEKYVKNFFADFHVLGVFTSKTKFEPKTKIRPSQFGAEISTQIDFITEMILNTKEFLIFDIWKILVLPAKKIPKKQVKSKEKIPLVPRRFRPVVDG